MLGANFTAICPHLLVFNRVQFEWPFLFAPLTVDGSQWHEETMIKGDIEDTKPDVVGDRRLDAKAQVDFT